MLIGHERQIAYLEAAQKRGTLAHAYLFYGPEGVGKATLARAFAKALYCEKSPLRIAEACGGCHACLAVDSGTHPAVTLLDRTHTLVSKKETRKLIPIEDIRELRRRFSFTALPGAMRIAIIDDAHTLSGDGADAFLKLLEEPGASTLFFLVAPSRELVGETLVSRAIPIRFSAVPEVVLGAAYDAESGGGEARDEILRLSQGRPGVMMRLIRDDAFRKEEGDLLKELVVILRDRDIGRAFRLSEAVWQDEERRQKVGEYLLRMFRKDLLSRAASDSPLVHIPAMKRIHTILSLLETTNVNPRLAMDVMFLTAIG